MSNFVPAQYSSYLDKLDADGLFIELSTLTSLTRAKWEEILSCPPALQGLILQNYRDQDWTTPGTSTFQKVLAVLAVIGTIAGVVGGVAGAAGAIKALTS